MPRSSVEALVAAGRRGRYGRDVDVRHGAAALMAAAAVAGKSGTAGQSESSLPLILPAPKQYTVQADRWRDFQAALGGSAGGASAYADTEDNTVHVRKGGMRDKYAVAHEIGHLLDAQVLTDVDRQRFAKMLRAPKGPWDMRHEDATPRGSAGEWFADYYAVAATGRGMTRRPKGAISSGGDEGSYADIGPRRLLKFQRAIDALARQHRLSQLKF